MSDSLTVGEFLGAILPRLHTDRKFPNWPPDCFALCLALLKRTGAYSMVLRNWSPVHGGSAESVETWNSIIVDLGRKWRTGWNSFDGMSHEWRLLCDSFPRPLKDLSSDSTLSQVVMK